MPNSRPGTAISQMPAATRPSRSAAHSSRGRRRPLGLGGRRAQRDRRQQRRPRTATPQNVGAMPIDVGERADRRADERAGHGGAHRRPDHLAAAVARRGARDPGHRARPRGGAADALDEAGERRAAPPSRRTRTSTQVTTSSADAEQHGRADARPRRQVAARERADERARRVRGGEDPGARLRQAVLVLEVRQQRGDRGEEDRVEEHDRRSRGAADGARPGGC